MGVSIEMGKTKKKFCYFGTLITFVTGIVCGVLVLASSYDSAVRHLFEPITSFLGVGGFVLSAGLILPVTVLCAEYYFNHKVDFERGKRNEAILRREEAIRKTEEEERKAEEARKVAEANAELWGKRWEIYIKPLLKLILIALAILVVVIVIVGGIESFISSFGIIAFLLVIVIIILLVKR